LVKHAGRGPRPFNDQQLLVAGAPAAAVQGFSTISLPSVPAAETPLSAWLGGETSLGF